jgi:hypothetical protein
LVQLLFQNLVPLCLVLLLLVLPVQRMMQATTASKFGSTLLGTTAPGATSPEDDARTS